MGKMNFLRTIMALVLSASLGSFAPGKQPQSPPKSVTIVGFILKYSEYGTQNGSTIATLLFSRPLIDGAPVRSAYVKVCIQPDADTCASDGFNLVSIQPITGAHGASTTGAITDIWHTRYYDTYYIDALTDIVPAN